MARICAVVAAAGENKRLPGKPKILTELYPGCTIWDLMKPRLQMAVEAICVVLSPAGKEIFRDPMVITELQRRPLGTADAVMSAWGIWRYYDSILVVWGDQANLSTDTIICTVKLPLRGITIPVVEMENPYTAYVFDSQNKLKVGLAREEDKLPKKALADVGLFHLSTAGLAEAWARGRLWETQVLGRVTRELNFPYFLAYLSGIGWPVDTILISDPGEARGVNTPEDLEFAKSRVRA